MIVRDGAPLGEVDGTGIGNQFPSKAVLFHTISDHKQNLFAVSVNIETVPASQEQIESVFALKSSHTRGYAHKPQLRADSKTLKFDPQFLAPFRCRHDEFVSFHSVNISKELPVSSGF